MRARDMPRVFCPARFSTFTAVTVKPTGFAVLFGIWIPGKKKSFAVTSFGSLQNFPFTNTA
ncbi:unnamed protein product [Malus baccata var. baccata]